VGRRGSPTGERTDVRQGAALRAYAVGLHRGPHVERSCFGLESPLKTSPEAANVALPDIGESFDSSQTMLDLIAVAYSLGLVASVLWLGALGDRTGAS
jgi:hypothetical protein